MLAIWCAVPGLLIRKGDAVHSEHEDDAFYLAKWTIFGLGAFGVSLLVWAILF